jgi:pimeloyl-ACP methyl ester carboxylesterase
VLRRLALMVPSAVAVRARYASLKMPIVIIAGEHDRLIDIDAQSARLPREITQQVPSRRACRSHGASKRNGACHGGDRRSRRA